MLKNGVVVPPGQFRMILALAVVASHVTPWEVGRLAVLLFFVLSGYWVTHIWDAKFGPGKVWAFYGARFFRIYPLYLLAVIGSAWHLSRPLQWEDVTLLGVANVRDDVLAVSWSLDIELQFYLALPLIIWGLRKASPVVALGLTMAAAAVAWLIHSHAGPVTLLQYLPAFVLGMLIRDARWTPGPRIALLGLAVFVAAGVALVVSPMTHGLLDKTAADPIDRDIFSFLWMAPLLPYVARSVAIPSGPLDRRLGDLSYPLYLVHLPVIDLVTAHVGFGRLGKAAGVLAALLLALLLHLVLDRPAEALRRRVFESRPREIPLP